MFVSFYDIESKKTVAFLEEMPVVPNANDKIMINKELYVVVNRMFSLDKKHRACAYVKHCEK